MMYLESTGPIAETALEYHQIGLASTLALQAAFYKIHNERLARQLVKILAVLSTHKNHVQKMVHTCSMYKWRNGFEQYNLRA